MLRGLAAKPGEKNWEVPNDSFVAQTDIASFFECCFSVPGAVIASSVDPG